MVSTKCGGTSCLRVTHLLQWLKVVPAVILFVSPFCQVQARLGDNRYRRQVIDPQSLNEQACIPFHNETNMQFTSPALNTYDENYPSNVDCVRVLEAPPDHLIRLDFRDYFDMEYSENCQHDYLEIRDGAHGYNNLKDKLFCGTEFPPLIVSSDRHLWIHFKSDASIEGRGFKAIYEFVHRGAHLNTPEIIPCYINSIYPYQGVLGLVNISQDIKDFNIKNNMPTDCLFNITLQPKWGIYLQFNEFTLENPNDCESNFVQVFFNNTDKPPKKMFCGSIAESVMHKSNVMYVRFFSYPKGTKTKFEVNYTAYVDITSENGKCGDIDEFYCEDATCVHKSLECNGKFNCRSRFDEDACKGTSETTLSGDHMIIIMVIFSLILIGMCITFVYNCVVKLIKDHQIMQEYEMEKHSHEKKSSSKMGSQSRFHSSPSMESNRFDAANAVNTPCYVPGGDILPILVRSEHSMSPSNGDAYNTDICTVDNDNPPEMCDSACQTRESLFTAQGYSSGNSSPNHSVHTNSPPAPFSTFGYQKDSKFKAEAKIEMAPQSRHKYNDKRRPYSVQTNKSAPDVIVTH